MDNLKNKTVNQNEVLNLKTEINKQEESILFMTNELFNSKNDYKELEIKFENLTSQNYDNSKKFIKENKQLRETIKN